MSEPWPGDSDLSSSPSSDSGLRARGLWARGLAGGPRGDGGPRGEGPRAACATSGDVMAWWRWCSSGEAASGGVSIRCVGAADVMVACASGDVIIMRDVMGGMSGDVIC